MVLDGDKSEHNCYTILQKMAYMEYGQCRMEEDHASMNMATDEVGVSNTSLSRWINNLLIYRHIAKTDQVRYSLVSGH